MPPKIQTTKEMILDAAFEIVRKDDYEHLSIRKIADQLSLYFIILKALLK